MYKKKTFLFIFVSLFFFQSISAAQISDGEEKPVVPVVKDESGKPAEEFGSSDDIESAGALYDIALAHDKQGNYEDALNCYRSALAIYEKKFGIDGDGFQVADTLHNIAAVERKKERLQQKGQKHFSGSLSPQQPATFIWQHDGDDEKQGQFSSDEEYEKKENLLYPDEEDDPAISGIINSKKLNVTDTDLHIVLHDYYCKLVCNQPADRGDCKLVLAIIDTLIKKKRLEAFNVENQDEDTALHVALKYFYELIISDKRNEHQEFLPIIEKLIKNMSPEALSVVNRLRNTALHVALKCFYKLIISDKKIEHQKFLPIIEKLIENMSPEAFKVKNRYEDTPLHVALKYFYELIISDKKIEYQEFLPIIEKLIENMSPEAFKVKNRRGNTPLHVALKYFYELMISDKRNEHQEFLPIIEKLIKNMSPEALSVVNQNGDTALSFAWDCCWKTGFKAEILKIFRATHKLIQKAYKVNIILAVTLYGVSFCVFPYKNISRLHGLGAVSLFLGYVYKMDKSEEKNLSRTEQVLFDHGFVFLCCLAVWILLDYLWKEYAPLFTTQQKKQLKKPIDRKLKLLEGELRALCRKASRLIEKRSRFSKDSGLPIDYQVLEKERVPYRYQDTINRIHNASSEDKKKMDRYNEEVATLKELRIPNKERAYAAMLTEQKQLEEFYDRMGKTYDPGELFTWKLMLVASVLMLLFLNQREKIEAMFFMTLMTASYLFFMCYLFWEELPCILDQYGEKGFLATLQAVCREFVTLCTAHIPLLLHIMFTYTSYTLFGFGTPFTQGFGITWYLFMVIERIVVFWLMYYGFFCQLTTYYDVYFPQMEETKQHVFCQLKASLKTHAKRLWGYLWGKATETGSNITEAYQTTATDEPHSPSQKEQIPPKNPGSQQSPNPLVIPSL